MLAISHLKSHRHGVTQQCTVYALSSICIYMQAIYWSHKVNVGYENVQKHTLFLWKQNKSKIGKPKKNSWVKLSINITSKQPLLGNQRLPYLSGDSSKMLWHSELSIIRLRLSPCPPGYWKLAKDCDMGETVPLPPPPPPPPPPEPGFLKSLSTSIRSASSPGVTSGYMEVDSRKTEDKQAAQSFLKNCIFTVPYKS